MLKGAIGAIIDQGDGMQAKRTTWMATEAAQAIAARLASLRARCGFSVMDRPAEV
jgi:hypothetical protein